MSKESLHDIYMQRCLQLAKNGLGTTYPNPLVGCVIVNNGKIIAEGWHKKAGEGHAEVVAINQIQDKALLRSSSLYVNLEPCNHFGKTPPCSKKIIDAGIREVYVGNVDPNPLVNRSGISSLEAAGVKVKHGILNDECNELNKRFFTYQTKKRPYIILKWAENQLGQIGSKSIELGSVPISSIESKQLCHYWRSQEQAILVGCNTVLQDKPRLNTRLVNGRNPTRIVLDPNGKSINILTDIETETHFFVQKNIKFKILKNQNYFIHTIDFKSDNYLDKLLQKLFEIGIQSVLVEGGAYTLEQFIKNELWDEIRQFKSTTAKILNPILAPILDTCKAFVSKKKIGGDVLSIYRKV